jgi:hypothetical protein
MLKKLSISLFAILILSCAAFSQKAYTPEKGSKDRTAILDALRVPVEKELKQKIQFSTETFKVQGNWAFINGEPQSANGGEPNYSITKYADAIEEGIFDNNFQALLKKTGGKWKVVTFAIGCTDVCWYGWDKDFKAPKAIFPATD